MPNVHDPVFTIPSEPPFRWGTSPFHVRGLVYREEMAYVDRLLERTGQRAADVIAKLNDPALESFLSQRFTTAEWYDLLPVIYLGAAVARARRISFMQYVRDSGVAHAETALTGFSAVVLKLVSNEAVAAWLPRISGWYHDFGRCETKVIGPRHVRGVRTGVPQVYVQSWGLTSMHFTEHVLARAGAKAPRAHPLEAEREGERDGMPVYRITFEVRWAE